MMILIISSLLLAMAFVPSGIREAERETSITSGALTFVEFAPESVVNLPYHALQRASFAVFGVSELSVKLASVILGILASIGLYNLIHEWFRRNVAVITTVLVATLPAFIFISQDGTPLIFAICAAIWLLLSATYVSRRREPLTVWKIIFFLMLGLNLYTPLGVYLNIAIISTVLFHPHIRHLTRKINPNRVAIAMAFSLILTAPLIYGLVSQPNLGLALLGIPAEMPNLAENARQLLTTFLSFSGQNNGILNPLLPIGILIIVAIGIYRFMLVKYTARSYVIWLWSIMLLPLLVLNPDYAALLIPLVALMVAMGINTLIAEWYKLFPLNPYARVFGLIPLSVIVAGIVFTSTVQYGYTYHYNPEISKVFRIDTRLLKSTADIAGASTDQKISLGVSPQELAYFQLVASYDQRFTPTTNLADTPLPYIVSKDYSGPIQTGRSEISHIAVNRFSEDSDRFYLYEAARR